MEHWNGVMLRPGEIIYSNLNLCVPHTFGFYEI